MKLLKRIKVVFSINLAHVFRFFFYLPPHCLLYLAQNKVTVLSIH